MSGGEIGPGTLVECVGDGEWYFTHNGKTYTGPKNGETLRVQRMYLGAGRVMRLMFAKWPGFAFDGQHFRPLGPRDPDWLSRTLAEHQPRPVKVDA